MVEVEEVLVVMVEIIVVVEDSVEIDHLEKCIKQFVVIAVMNVKYHLSQETINQFTVMIVSRIIDEINWLKSQIHNRYYLIIK